MVILSASLFVLVLVPSAYLIFIAIAATRGATPVQLDGRYPSHRFAIAIPAHNEAAVIKETVRLIFAVDYPKELYEVHMVADHCSDNTAEIARESGACVHERNARTRGGKGEALSWLFNRILIEDVFDAVIVFDADTRIHPSFLRVMDARLENGEQVIQGQHIISNPDKGWFPALTWAMFLIDNRFQNLGRTNLGWSAKNMGDSICIRVDVIRKSGWGIGLTEDYELRQRLLLEGVKIYYEPEAKGFGEAPKTWKQAKGQRARWLRGAHNVGKKFRTRLLVEGAKQRDTALIDGALQAYLPSFSSLTLICLIFLLSSIVLELLEGFQFPQLITWGWASLLGILFLYPFLGLVLERAPIKAYFVILSGPFFILWRSILAFSVRTTNRPEIWKRTSHGG